MKISRLNQCDFNIYKEKIFNLLVEIYHINSDMDIDIICKICKEKIVNLQEYILSSNTFLLGAFKENEMIAFAWAFIYSKDNLDKILHINQIIVEELYRNNGIAKKLLEGIEQFSKDNNINIIELNVAKTNDAALNLYQSIGFDTKTLCMIKKLKDKNQ